MIRSGFIFGLILNCSLLALSQGDSEWWKHSIVYQIYPRSFQDSDNDGVGDLAGIESRLDYLKYDVTMIWLSPIYESPMVDFGYDVSNFTRVDPIFGTMEDFKSLVDSAHEKGIKVVLDFIPNHSSDQHEWFQKSLAKEDPYTDYYVWVDPKGFDDDGNPIPPSNWISRFRGSMWTFREERQQFYLHQYLVQQPDLNYRNPAVKQIMFDNLKFWMDQGVDGFRLDAVTKLVEDDTWPDELPNNDSGIDDEGDWLYWNHTYTNNLAETRDILADFWNFVKTYKSPGQDTVPERVMMLEAWLTIEETMEYYKCGDFPFNFNFVNLDEAPTAKEVVDWIFVWLDNMPDGGTADWVLGNHDRKRIGTRLGKGMRDIFNMISLTLPGISVVYYGEEIGMVDADISYEDTQDPWGCNCGPENYVDCSRDPARTPMQWSNEKNAGFSNATSTWLPVNKNYPELNYDDQLKEGNSHAWIFSNLSAIRDDYEPFVSGVPTFATLGNIYLMKRSTENEDAIVFANFDQSTEYFIDVQEVFGLEQTCAEVLLSTTGDHDRFEILELISVTINGGEGLILYPKNNCQ